MELINTIIGIPLGYLMWVCYTLVKNYGLAIIVFTFFTKVIMFPISLWVQKNSVKMVTLQPQVNNLMAQYAGNRDKAAEEQMALYKREGYKPLSGVVPMLLQIPIILGLISVVYNPMQHLLHLDSNIIEAFVNQAQQYVGSPLGSTGQLKVIELIQNPDTLHLFQNIAVEGSQTAITTIQNMDLTFLGFNMAHFPQIGVVDIYWLIPIVSGLSSFALSFFQNRENVLQREQSFWGKWGMALFLTAFSTYFAFIVPAGVGLYWITGNILSTFLIYILNWIHNPKKYIDYKALEESKKRLEESKEVEKKLKLTPEQKAKSKADYKRFIDEKNTKQLVYYSEKSGFYKYFKDQIELILERSDIDIHYLTSDPNDAIFEMDNPRIIPYYVDDNRLIPLYMQVDCDVFVTTTPNLQTYHLKRSMVNKKIEYIYTPHVLLSLHMVTAKGAYDHYDTLFCVGQHHVEEARELERVYQTKEKNLVACGYPLIDNLTAEYEKLPKVENERKKILIAPSWQEDNILDSCVDDLLGALLDKGYDITLRPHPEYVKRYPMQMQAIINRYKDKMGEHFAIETDFSSNVTIFTADLVITDWSGIAFEFAYATKRPCLFINTPMKVMNPEWEKISCVPIEISLRDKIGISVELDAVKSADKAVASLFDKKQDYKTSIETAMENTLFCQGQSASVAADYIIKAVQDKQK